MKAKLILIGSVVVLIVGCKPTYTPPENMLSEVEMVEILTEIRLAEAGLFAEHTRLYNEDSIKMQTQVVYQEIFKKHDISYKDYQENLTYYISKPAVLNKVFEKVTLKIQADTIE